MGTATAPPTCKLCRHAHHLRDPHIFAGSIPEKASMFRVEHSSKPMNGKSKSAPLARKTPLRAKRKKP